MKRWIMPPMIVIVLIVLALTASRWTPALLGFVSDNSDVIQGLTDLVQLLLWAGAGIVALLGWRRGRRRQAQQLQPSAGQAHADVSGAGAAAQQGGIAGGQQAIVAHEVRNSALATGPGSRAVWAETYIENLEHLPDPEKARIEEARTRYLLRLRQRCNVLPLAAMGGEEDTDDEVSLDQVYQDLDTGSRVPLTEEERQARKEQREFQLPGRGEDDRALTALEAATKHRRLVLLGDPGSGKSTFVRQLAARLAVASPDGSAGLPGWPAGVIPLLAALRELAPDLAALQLHRLSEDEQNRRLAGAVREHWLRGLAAMQAADFAPGLENALDKGAVLLIFDGLDEVAEALRPRVRQALRAVSQAYPAVQRILVTCRIRSYVDEAVLPGYAAETLAPFDEEKIKRFVAAWYREQERLGRVDGGRAQRSASDLQRAALSGDLRELAANPMLLTTMAIIHQREVGLPRERVRLYSLAVQVLLNRWQKRKGIGVSPELAEVLRDDIGLRRILEHLAYLAHQRQAQGRQDGELARSDLLALLEKGQHLGSAGLAADFLDYIDLRAGLLVGHGGGEDGEHPPTYSFPHRTFQEYLAGCQMVAGRGVDREYWARAAEGDFWQLAALLGAEELKYNRRSEQALLDLAYDLCPGMEPADEQSWRAALWSGQMAALLGCAAIELDREKPDGGHAYLARLFPRLVGILRESPLPPIERAEAGRVLARLGDSRPGVGLDEATGLPDICWQTVAAGPFLMGSDDEKPQHRLAIDYDYWLARYPLSNAQFAAFVAAGGYGEPRYWPEAEQAGRWKDGQVKMWGDDEPRSAPYDFGEPYTLANHPVVAISWYEALAFSRWLDERLRAAGRLPEGWSVSLPSEAEWEKAARGGDDGRVYPWEGDFDANLANSEESGIGTTSALGCFPGGASPYGCEELSGNVWEWTRSLYGDYPYPKAGKAREERENLAAGDRTGRVLRGGSYYDNRTDVRCSARYWHFPVDGFRIYGFRVVASPLPEGPPSGLRKL